MTNGWSSKILTKFTGKGPAWRRTIRAGTYNILPDMKFLDTYPNLDPEVANDTDQLDQNNDRRAADYIKWQRDSNEIASNSLDNISFNDYEHYDFASSRDGVG